MLTEKNIVLKEGPILYIVLERCENLRDKKQARDAYSGAMLKMRGERKI